MATPSSGSNESSPKAQMKFSPLYLAPPTFFPFKAARKGGTLEVKNLAEGGGKLLRPKVGRTCPLD